MGSILFSLRKASLAQQNCRQHTQNLCFELFYTLFKWGGESSVHLVTMSAKIIRTNSFPKPKYCLLLSHELWFTLLREHRAQWWGKQWANTMRCLSASSGKEYLFCFDPDTFTVTPYWIQLGSVIPRVSWACFMAGPGKSTFLSHSSPVRKVLHSHQGPRLLPFASVSSKLRLLSSPHVPQRLLQCQP